VKIKLACLDGWLNMGYWLFKEEPSHYSFDDLLREGRTVWDGVENNLALKYLRNTRRDDRAFFYHTGSEKRIVGIMRIVTDPYRPAGSDTRLVVVDVVPESRLPRPVGLEEIRADCGFAGFELLRIPRLSVMPVPAHMWNKIIEMAAGK
jgi:predicted RNA-binding protein with PUA-like domain